VDIGESPAGTTSGQPVKHESNKTEDQDNLYTCPMHPEVMSDKPGPCPKCGTDLVPKKAEILQKGVAPDSHNSMADMPGM
jgi:uncharacterized protein with PIN domain